MKIDHKSIASNPVFLFSSKTLILAAGLALTASTVSAQTQWQGGTSDYNNPASWNGTYNGSSNPNVTDDSGSNNVVLIQPGDPVWQHGDTLAGNAANTSGAYLQTGSTNNSGGGNWLRMGLGAGSFGSYILSNGTVNVGGRTQIGENGIGYLEIDGGTYNGNVNDGGANPAMVCGQGDFGPGTGTLVINGGSVNYAQETWFGEQGGSIGTGYFFMNGGTLNVNNWFVFGRNGGAGGAHGYGTMTGGTINFHGGGQFLVGGGGVGSLAQSGGTINAYNQYLIPQSDGGSGGSGLDTLSSNAVLNVHDWLAVGRSGGNGELDISGSASITRDNASDGGSHFDIGASATGVLNQNGGTITESTSDLWIGENGAGTWNFNGGTAYVQHVVMCVNGSASGQLNLNGGLFQTAGITSPTTGTTVSLLNLNGATVQANGNNAAFINGLFQAAIGSGGVTLDTQGYSVTIPQALVDNGGGTLAKIGSGTLTLTGANGYAGTTAVNAGTLATTTASSGGGAYAVANGSTLNVQVVGSLNSYLGMSSLSFDSSATTLGINLNSFGNPGTAPISVSGPLTVNGPVTINVTDANPQIGQFPLISYSSKTGSSYVLGSIPPGITAHLVDNTTNQSIDLDITAYGVVRWDGNAGGNWDIGLTTNWVDPISGLPAYFQPGDVVTLDDNATGTTSINVSANVTPSSLTINNTAKSYTLSGTGSISGTTGLVKEGANTATINNNNGYTGATVLTGGALSVSSLANGGSSSSIGASSAASSNLILAGGTLQYTGPAVSIDHGYTEENTNGTVDISVLNSLTLSGTVADIPGSGFVKSGPGQLAYAGTGVSTLADSLGYSVEQGSVAFEDQTNNINGNLVVAGPSFGFPVPGSSNAAVTVTTNATVNIGNLLDVGDSANTTNQISGVVTQTGGTVIVNGATQLGQYPNGAGTYNLSGGLLNTHDWLSVGRQGGVGTFNMSGGVLWCSGGGNLDIGNSGGVGGYGGTGVFNQTGGIITNTATEVWLGEAAGEQPDSGTWNMSGGAAYLSEVHVGVGGTGTSALNVSGSATITESYLLLANYDTNTIANMSIGSVTNPGGTVTVNADMDIGGQGTSTLNFVPNGGGKLTVTGTIYLSRFSQTANGTVNLNTGGTLVAGYINNGWGFQNNFSSPTQNPNAFNFNGGTLRAYVGSPYFIQPYVNAVVQTNGAIIDDGGNSIDVLAPLVNGGGGGGLTKLGSGTLILHGADTYTGTTLVNSGVLTMAPGGSIAGPVQVASGATLAGDNGSIGAPYSINNSLTLAAGSSTLMQVTPSSSDQITGLTTVSYGGTLVVTNASGSPLVSGHQYQLFNSALAGSGNFSSIVILSAVGGPYAGTFDAAHGILTVSVAGQGIVNAPALSGGSMTVTGSGWNPGAHYTWLSSTNAAAPISQWVTNTTGTFSASGAFTNTFVATNPPAEFLLLRTP